MENKEAEALECMADGDKCVNSSKGSSCLYKIWLNIINIVSLSNFKK